MCNRSATGGRNRGAASGRRRDMRPPTWCARGQDASPGSMRGHGGVGLRRFVHDWTGNGGVADGQLAHAAGACRRRCGGYSAGVCRASEASAASSRPRCRSLTRSSPDPPTRRRELEGPVGRAASGCQTGQHCNEPAAAHIGYPRAGRGPAAVAQRDQSVRRQGSLSITRSLCGGRDRRVL